MPDLFQSIFTDGEAVGALQFLACLGVAFFCGAVFAFAYTFRSRFTRSFAVTLFLLPAVCAVVICAVNGNIGAGVAVAGAFSLVRFRSSPGSAREICAIFISMCIGLLAGMGYLAYAVLFTVILSVVLFLTNRFHVWDKRRGGERILRVTIPEDLNYTQAFDDLFEKYTTAYETVSVKTTNMGSMYKLKYRITLKDEKQEKEFMDEIRCRNGNLEVAVMQCEESDHEL